ncbi:ABC transporter ATP-binding protein/permease [Paenibacillus vulneris]|uniref:ATP-binding cassette domain-containing protein n=1 Tax=Paenibacillus vulneris TaxID=1133364 RepID=A0ABW3UXI9_9BACL
MLKLQLDNIKKIYKSGETVTAVKGVSIGFRSRELVSILGPSGCGKTSLLNIIGGLDQYDSGDLIINGVSTKQFKDSDWDAYRNHSIGFVFQSYNLIGHQTVLQNVEIAMTLSGVKASERKRRAQQALKQVGLSEHMNKKPNQLSGGQMQRVAIARALVNDPDIILADEPTGALDSQTSDQVMDILKEVSKTRLVIMVTHNAEQAEAYSDRIIRMLDGQVQSDSDPITQLLFSSSSKTEQTKPQKTSMSLQSATLLSFKNLLTKRGRTIITAFAGSIGIIGVALVLALSNGLSNYIGSLQSTTLSGLPININAGIVEGTAEELNTTTKYTEYPDQDVVYSYNNETNVAKHTNVITEPFLDYVAELQTKFPKSVNNISYTYGLQFNLLAKGQNTVVNFNNGNEMIGTPFWQQLPENKDIILSQYDLVGSESKLPSAKDEVVLIVDKYNRIDKAFFEKIGITGNSNYKITDFIGKSILKVIPNNEYYTEKSKDSFAAATPADYEKLYNDGSGTTLKITGILRPKKGTNGSYLSPGIAYTHDLTTSVLEDARKSDIALAQKKSNTNVMLGTPFADEASKVNAEALLGANTTPAGISIYPKDLEGKEKIKEYLDQYNDGKPNKDQLLYSDFSASLTSVTKKLLNGITYVLTGFAAISLFVSTIMIGIITYVSVIERTKEIGILRSVGARKKDISRVFNAETLLIGFTAGLLGVGITYVLTVPMNLIIQKLADISGVANLSPMHAAFLVIGSMVLTLIAGIIPSKMAAGKDPVVALRSE